MSQNDSFYQVCEQWLKAALQLLTQKQLPLEQDIEVTLLNPNGYQTRRGIYKVDIGGIFSLYHTELFGLPEFENVVDLVLKSPALSSVLCMDASGKVCSEISIQRDFIAGHLSSLLFWFLTKNNQKTFYTTSIFERLYTQLEQYIYQSEPFNSTWLVHLQNIASEVPSISLDRGVILRQVPDDEKITIVKESARFPYNRLANSGIPDTFLEIHQPIDRILPPNQEDVTVIAQAVVLALRLLKENPVGMISYRWNIDQPFRKGGGTIYAPLLLPGAFSGQKYILTTEEAILLPMLYKKARKAYKDPKLTTSITRFDDSYIKLKNEDKLIDYWITLEALFFSLIPKEYVGSMGDTVATNIAYYIGSSESDRRSIYEFMSCSHKARGYFVHGQRGKAPQNLNSIIKKTANHLRAALRKRIEEKG